MTQCPLSRKQSYLIPPRAFLATLVLATTGCITTIEHSDHGYEGMMVVEYARGTAMHPPTAPELVMSDETDRSLDFSQIVEYAPQGIYSSRSAVITARLHFWALGQETGRNEHFTFHSLEPKSKPIPYGETLPKAFHKVVVDGNTADMKLRIDVTQVQYEPGTQSLYQRLLWIYTIGLWPINERKQLKTMVSINLTDQKNNHVCSEAVTFEFAQLVWTGFLPIFWAFEQRFPTSTHRYATTPILQPDEIGRIAAYLVEKCSPPR